MSEVNNQENNVEKVQQEQTTEKTKFCKHCGQKIPELAVICPKCGCQVETLKSEQPNIVINNSNDSINTNANVNVNGANAVPGKWINKWIAFLLCFFLGFLGAHKFYEGKIGMGILYFFTLGIFGVGWIVDTIAILLKPNPYFVMRA